jgi:type I restriction-modification system DNA methylase subunit
MAKIMLEDEVRNKAAKILGIDDNVFKSEKEGFCGVGQITTFNQLGFKGIIDKPDGWYLPNNSNEVAMVFEFKSSDKKLEDKKWVNELFKNIDILSTKYNKTIGILYNGESVLVYKNKELIDLKNELFTKEYYLKLFNKEYVDKQLIFSLTEKINNNLHKNFGVNNLYHRMIFTACALVAQRYNSKCLIEGMDWATLHQSILSSLKKSYEEAKKQNNKLDLIAEQFALIQCNYTENQEAINSFISCINQISSNINSDSWNGEDVMAIFFNEFTRYKGKSEQGQVFTPDHITSLIYRITGTSYKDNVLDATCGSGSFLVKAMSFMISEVGGLNNEEKVKDIKTNKLFGIEFSKELYALACANMLIHKDGKTNLIQDDSRSESVGNWIKEKKITKVLMNPPYENAYGCLNIVSNVLDNVNEGAICAFILPDNKLEVGKHWAKKVLKKHTLEKIIKLPNVFLGMASVETSIFIFEAHKPQNNREIFSCWIKEDGLENVKNKGRLDVFNKWQDIENKWIEVIYKKSGDDSIKWLNPNDILMYKIKKPENEIYENDFKKNILKYFLFKNPTINESFIVKEIDNEIVTNSIKILSFLETTKELKTDVSEWKEYKLSVLFNIKGSKTTSKNILEEYGDGKYPYITTKGTSQGVDGYYNFFTEEKNVLTFDSATIGTCFYQNNNFSASDHVELCIPYSNSFNEKNGLFFQIIINKTNYEKYNYGFKCNQQRIKQTIIKLPSILNEETKEYEPNWQYMEDYITNLENELNGYLK